MSINKTKIFSKEWWKESLELNESPPINFEDDDNYDYVEDNLGPINKASLHFNIPVDDLQYAFDAGQNVILNDDVWSKLENTNSYQIETLGQVILQAKQQKIDITPYLKAIKNKQILPEPLVLRYESDKYYLVAGEIVLSLYKALNQTPEVLQATLNLNLKESLESKSENNLVEKFIDYCKDKLQLSQIPKIEFSDDTNHVKEQCSFGYFSPESKAIWVYVGDRNMADIFRTLAHELVHRKQDEDGRIDYESGKTGSDIENEANSMAGVILRDFGKSNPDIYDTPMNNFIKSDLQEIKINEPVPSYYPLYNNIHGKDEFKEDFPYLNIEDIVKKLYLNGYRGTDQQQGKKDIISYYDGGFDVLKNNKSYLANVNNDGSIGFLDEEGAHFTLDEIKINAPSMSKISLDELKRLLVQDMKKTAEELEFEEPEEYVQDFKEELDHITDDDYSLVNISTLYENIGFSDDQLYLVLKRIFIK